MLVDVSREQMELEAMKELFGWFGFLFEAFWGGFWFFLGRMGRVNLE